MLNKVRRELYRWARILGDINAIRKGKIGTRIRNKVVGRLTRKLYK